MGFNQTSSSVCVACVFALGMGAYWFFQIAPYTARAQNGRLTGEAIARRNERDYHFAGEITGRVLLDNGQPAVHIPVKARFVMHQTGAQGEGEALTDGQGYYRIHGLNPQGFIVQVENGGTPYIPEPARQIKLTGYPNRIASNINFTLRLGPQITVRVREAERGAPVQGIEVNATPFIGTGGQRIGETNAQGDFMFRANSPFVQMRLSADKLRKDEIYAAPGYSFYKQLNVQNISATNVVWEVKVYKNAFGYVPATFRGLVKDAQGAPVAGADVLLQQDYRRQTTVTDAAGRFSLPAHRVRPIEHDRVLLQVEKGVLSATVFPTPEQTWGEIPVQLSATPRTTVTGQAFSTSGCFAAGVPVTLFGVVSDPSGSTGLPPRTGGVTGVNGQFTFSGLQDDAHYQLRFGGQPPRGQKFLWGRSVFPDFPYNKDWLHLKNGEIRNVGRVIVYAADAIVAGRIVSARNHPMREFHVVAEGKHCRTSVSPDAQGYFRLENLVREPLILGVYQSEDKGNTFRTSPGSLDDVYQAPVQAGDTHVSVTVTKDRSENTPPSTDARAARRK